LNRHAASCETIDVSDGEPKDQLAQILGTPEVDCGADCVGFEAHGHCAHDAGTIATTGDNVAGFPGATGVSGVRPDHSGDPGARTEEAKHGSLSIRLGLGWAKSHSLTTGQCPVMRYHRRLMMAILSGRTNIARNVNTTVIPLDEAPQGYTEFDHGMAKKFVLDPHGLIGA
jgi:glutathione-independent formaldehyde dehydrogenase